MSTECVLLRSLTSKVDGANSVSTVPVSKSPFKAGLGELCALSDINRCNECIQAESLARRSGDDVWNI